MRYYLDTEFIEDGKTIEMISIGLVAEDGRELYFVNSRCDFTRANDWVQKNVLPQLPPLGATNARGQHLWQPPTEISQHVIAFVHGDPLPRFWAWYAAYDWVVFCQLFGTMMQLPKGFPMFCFDLVQCAAHLGITESLKLYVPQSTGNHDALEDARWNKRAHEYLMTIDQQRRASRSP